MLQTKSLPILAGLLGLFGMLANVTLADAARGHIFYPGHGGGWGHGGWGHGGWGNGGWGHHNNNYYGHHHGHDNFYGSYRYPWWGLGYGAYDGGYGDSYGYGGEDYYPASSSAHVHWCLGRYRSYDPRSDTFVGYDGYQHPCHSPY